MADQNPRRDKAEGDRQDSPNEATRQYDQTGNEASGITNRPLEEEIENQEALPNRGQRQDEARGGGGDMNREREDVNRERQR